MASTMAAMAAHSKPPFPLPAVPRIRPPPIPKGTPGPNTLPVSGPPPYPSAVWADGKWRNPNSMSALHKSKTVSRQMEKALQHEVHGMNIYAYKHFSTNQVVYSLTNNMNENKILKQLIYHGKKTVPDEIRPDVWRPYFSIHFPKTPSGAAKGLKVYQELRELSMKRQLDPPVTKTHFMMTKRVLDADGKGGRKYKLVRVPTARRLDKKTRAQRLMNQKASSVADVAAVLTRHASLPYTPAQQITSRTEEKKQLDEGLSSRASKRLAIIRGEEEEKAREIEERSSYLQHPPGNVVLDRDTQARISIEYEGVVNMAQEHGNDTRLGMHNAAKTATEEEVGAQARYEAAFTEWKAKRAAAIEAVEKSMTETVDRQIAQMSEAEQAQIRTEMEVERQSLRLELDEKISQSQEAFRNEREAARAGFKSPPDWKQQLELHRMKNAHSAEMRDLRMDADRRTKWVGPYAQVYESVVNTEQEFDNQWAEIKPKLESDIELERATYSDPDYHNVEIRWADVRDGTYAREWPDSVTHLELQPKAVAMASKSVKTNNGVLTGRAVSKTVHLFGSDEPAQTELDSILLGRYAAPHLLESVAARNRYERVEKEITAHFVNVFKRLQGEARTLHEQAARLEEEFEEVDDLPLFYTAHDKIAEANGLLDSIMLTKDSDDVAAVKEIALWLRENVPTIDEEWKNAQWQRRGRMDKALSQAAQITQTTLDPEGPEVGKARIEWINTAAELLQMEVENIDAFRAGFTSGNWRTHVKDAPHVERTRVVRREGTEEESPKKQGMWTRVKGLFGR